MVSQEVAKTPVLGYTGALRGEAADGPIVLTARATNWYGTPLVRPSMVQAVSGAVKEQVSAESSTPSGLACTV